MIRQSHAVLASALLAAMAAACVPPTSSPSDGGSLPTTALTDGGLDAGAVQDAGSMDSGPQFPLPGFGVISGGCNNLDDTLLLGSQPALLSGTRMDFGTDPYDDADLTLLTAGGQQMVAAGNAGGSSLLSEVFSLELLERCEGATLLKTETQVAYSDPQSKLTDILVQIDGHKVGVSVTRAVGFPRDAPYTVQTARTLLERKLNDIQNSTANVVPADRWVKQILHVIAYADAHAVSMAEAYALISPTILADTLVMVSVTDGSDEVLY